MVQKFDTTKQAYSQLLADASEIERRANEAGVQLIKAEEHLENLNLKVEEQTQLKHNQESLLNEIENVRLFLINNL